MYETIDEAWTRERKEAYSFREFFFSFVAILAGVALAYVALIVL